MTLGSHQRTIGRSQDHITPKYIIDMYGPFKLDPCAAVVRPWDCAEVNWTSDGLVRNWRPFGMKYVNPPFNQYEVGDWIAKAADEGNGNAIVLLHARTEAGWFMPVWRYAACILFLHDRIRFCRPDGSQQPHNSGAPPILVAFGEEAAQRLYRPGLAGSLVTRWHIQAAGAVRPQLLVVRPSAEITERKSPFFSGA